MAGKREETVAIRASVRGSVQGVGFRDAATRQAGALGVRGWVRNEADGSVRAHLEGEPAAVDELVRWCRTGPPKAQVEDVHIAEARVEGAVGFTD